VRTAYAVEADTLIYLLRKGKISEDVIDIMHEEALCEAYGWTPDYVKNMEAEDFAIYLSIVLGKSDRRKLEAEHGRRSK
jgi:hypothetical protein